MFDLYVNLAALDKHAAHCCVSVIKAPLNAVFLGRR